MSNDWMSSREFAIYRLAASVWSDRANMRRGRGVNPYAFERYLKTYAPEVWKKSVIRYYASHPKNHVTTRDYVPYRSRVFHGKNGLISIVVG